MLFHYTENSNPKPKKKTKRNEINYDSGSTKADWIAKMTMAVLFTTQTS
jgi:hypothetical protein